MSTDSASTRRDQLMLAADGCLVTAGAFALMTGIAFGLDALGVAPLGEPQGTGLGLAVSILSWLLQVGAFVVGPIVVWLLYRRHFEKIDLVALVVGFVFAGALVMPVVMLGAGLQWLVGLFASAEYAGAIAYLVLVSSVFLLAVAWSSVDAFRDLTSVRGHVPLDTGRLAAVLAVIGFTAVVIAETMAGNDAIEAFAFLLLAGFQGAATVFLADLVGRFLRMRAAAAQEPLSQA